MNSSSHRPRFVRVVRDTAFLVLAWIVVTAVGLYLYPKYHITAELELHHPINTDGANIPAAKQLEIDAIPMKLAIREAAASEIGRGELPFRLEEVERVLNSMSISRTDGALGDTRLSSGISKIRFSYSIYTDDSRDTDVLRYVVSKHAALESDNFAAHLVKYIDALKTEVAISTQSKEDLERDIQIRSKDPAYHIEQDHIAARANRVRDRLDNAMQGRVNPDPIDLDEIADPARRDYDPPLTDVEILGRYSAAVAHFSNLLDTASGKKPENAVQLKGVTSLDRRWSTWVIWLASIGFLSLCIVVWQLSTRSKALP